MHVLFQVDFCFRRPFGLFLGAEDAFVLLHNISRSHCTSQRKPCFPGGGNWGTDTWLPKDHFVDQRPSWNQGPSQSCNPVLGLHSLQCFLPAEVLRSYKTYHISVGCFLSVHFSTSYPFSPGTITRLVTWLMQPDKMLPLYRVPLAAKQCRRQEKYKAEVFTEHAGRSCYMLRALC